MIEKFCEKHINNICVAVFFAENVHNPETLLDTILDEISNRWPNLTMAYILFTYSFEHCAYSKKQNIKVCYQIKRDSIDQILKVKSFSIKLVNSLNIVFKKSKISKNCFQFCTNKLITITVSFDNYFYKSIHEKFYKIEKQKVCFKTNSVLFFEPIFIPKPWGQEVWFTGAEKRGVSKLKPKINTNMNLPLVFVFSALPKRMLGNLFHNKDITLVKVLDPFPDEIFGDLYYELHSEKNEVYIVTEIVNSVGKIKFGINKNKLNEFSNDLEEFKKQFIFAIKQYEKTRREIDFLFDKIRINNNIPLNLPVSINKIKEWMNLIPMDLLIEEKKKRQEMDSFAGYLKLNIGDVIRVPVFVPHALQHGVKVIEFQTPTYERYIISFAQKVLTQENWDTDKAFENINLLFPQKSELEVLNHNEYYTEELVCSFDEFKSSRFTVKTNYEFTLDSQNYYRILFNVNGTLQIIVNLNNKINIMPGTCIFLPAATSVKLIAYTDVTFLICVPK